MADIFTIPMVVSDKAGHENEQDAVEVQEIRFEGTAAIKPQMPQTTLLLRITDAALMNKVRKGQNVTITVTT